MKVSLDELERTTKRAILTFGYTDSEADVILSVLMYAQLRGNNQGVVKLIGSGIPKGSNVHPPVIEKETELSALIDGGNTHAMVVVNYAVDVAIAKARESGVGLVGVNHLNTSSGAIGYYARRVANEGMIGIVFAGASPLVAAAGSYQPVFGTNPLAFAMPSLNEPVVLDMATAAMAFFGVIEAKTAGRLLPANVAYDANGSPTVDPAEAIKGALRTFDGGAKSSGLSMMVQALTGPLVGASFVGLGEVSANWGGHLVIAIDPDLFRGADALRQGVSAMAETVKNTKRLPGVNEIMLPGERGDRQTTTTRERGVIEIEANLYQELTVVAQRGP